MMTLSRPRALLLALPLLVLPGCAGPDRRAEQRPTEPVSSTAEAANGASIFDLELALTDQNGQHLALADLRGHVTVAAMIYSSCRSVCPRVTEDMKAIEAEVSVPNGAGVRFVLFSLDPGRDTPSALTQFATDHALDTSRWRLLAASAEGVRDLAAVLGVKYRAESTGEIEHSAMIFVIDRDGLVRHRQVGLGHGSRELVAAITQARS